MAALLSIELRYSTRVFSKQIFGNLFLSSDWKFLITVAWISEVEFRNLKLEKIHQKQGWQHPKNNKIIDGQADKVSYRADVKIL